MGWEAKTTNARIGVGTPLFVLEVPQVDGQPNNTLPAPVALPITFVNSNNVDKAFAISRVGNLVTLRLADGTVHEMSPAMPGDVTSGITFRRMYGEDWIIRK